MHLHHFAPHLYAFVFFVALTFRVGLAQDFRSGQAADGVVGKPDFTTAGNATPTATNTGFTGDIAIDPASGKVFVSDTENNRILRFNSADDAISGQPADGVFGQPDFVSGTPNNGGISATSLQSPKGIFLDRDGRLWVADRFNHRVLRYDDAALDPFTLATRTADGQLGQGSLTSASPFLNVNRMNQPLDVFGEPNGSIWVVDSGNNRVLRFNGAASLGNGASASVVYGQTDFEVSISTVSQSRFFLALSACVDSAGRLWVGDNTGRVLRFDHASTIGSNGLGADAVLGQPNFTSGTFATTAAGMKFPGGVEIDNATGRLYVADSLNNRVTWYNLAAQKANGAEADGVLGQSSFTTSTAGTSATRFTGTGSLFLDGTTGRLWLATARRALRFSPTAAPATPIPAAPAVTIRGKKSLATTKSTLVLKGTATGAVTRVEVKVGNKTGTASNTANWTFKAKLKPGKNRITVIAQGPGGSSAAAKLTVTRR